MEHKRNGIPGMWQARAALRRLVRWGVRRRRVAAGYVLRGVCSGIGTTAVGLAVVWLQSRR
ncbi:hypothetical protein [Streptomyces sp. DH37]|uniref:hypothetical protein n=1 Tax=Streptomyces sp. DH37 TaxID=3040122 RepID=UPI002440FA32|nr:hypothetical protein [Streptomyces sp. DH37]MDG9705885.1 hypothetical protein [Streptomyces sp. DH37]